MSTSNIHFFTEILWTIADKLITRPSPNWSLHSVVATANKTGANMLISVTYTIAFKVGSLGAQAGQV